MARPVTLHDVATRVGVSPRTVSRVVNNEDGYSEITRKRVIEAIAELGYRPNLLARGLIGGRTGTIGLVVPQMLDPFFPDLAHGVQSAARSNATTLFLSGTENSPELQQQIFDSMRSHGVDGVIVFPAPGGDADILALADSGVAVVVVDQEVVHPAIGLVSSDLLTGAIVAVDHLLDRGHTSVAMIANEVSPTARRIRERGFIDAHARRGLTPGPIVRSTPDVAGGEKATDQILATYPETTAVFAYNDLMASGLMIAARRAGKSLPADLAVVGFDNIQLSELLSPALTTVSIDRTRLGAEAVAMLLSMTDDSASDGSGAEHLIEPLVLPVELIERDSS